MNVETHYMNKPVEAFIYKLKYLKPGDLFITAGKGKQKPCDVVDDIEKGRALWIRGGYNDNGTYIHATCVSDGIFSAFSEDEEVIHLTTSLMVNENDIDTTGPICEDEKKD